MATAKDNRIYLRASKEQINLIRRAAEVKRKTTSEFVLDSACRSAESALYDLRTLRLDEKGWSQFVAALDRDAQEIPELIDLFNEEAPWD
jgi:uncharacterized protein (DUF1778 family)